MRFIPGPLLAIIGLLVAKPAEAISVDEIVTRANNAFYYAGDDGMARGEMVISDKAGRKRTRTYTILRTDKARKDGGDQFHYVFFHSPGDVRKTVFLVHKHTRGDDDRWLYLPGLDLVRRIAASDGRTSFIGSHFLYEDVSGRSILADEHTLHEENAKHYVLKNVPKDPASVEFQHYLMWIDKKTFLPIRADYIDRAGKVTRRIRATKVKMVSGIPTILETIAEDLLAGGSTLIRFSGVKYNLGIDEEFFTERYLRTPPSKYIRP